MYAVFGLRTDHKCLTDPHRITKFKMWSIITKFKMWSIIQEQPVFYIMCVHSRVIVASPPPNPKKKIDLYINNL